MKKKNAKINPKEALKSKLQAKIRNFKLFQIERALERKVIADIRKRQKSIPGLKQDPLKYTAVWGDGKLTPGCQGCCLKGRWIQIRTTTKCNLNCHFCYYFGEKDYPLRELIPADMYKIGERFYSADDVKLLLEKQGKKFLSGVAWLHHEPLLEIEKMLGLMKFIHKNGYHQWLYTNGTLATEENLKKLSAAGLDEIRFNLAATNCSDSVIKNMKAARRYFRYLCVESPMTTEFYRSFLKKRKAILDTKVDHIHFAELQLFPETKTNFKNEGPVYRYRNGYVSPIKSRQLVYDIFELAVKEGWKNVALHDCSNETKFYRGINSGAQYFGDTSYRGFMELDSAFYLEALTKNKFSNYPRADR